MTQRRGTNGKIIAKVATTTIKKKTSRVVASKHLGGFMGFVREQGVVGLAVGLVLGTQVKTLVDQLVASFINPLVGLLLPGEGNLAEKTFHISLFGKTEPFAYGAFIAVLISFITVAGVVYFGVKGLRLDKLDKPKN